jgi:hypothetical protein
MGDPRGDFGLRSEILAHFGPARQVRCDIDRIVVVYGVQHALDLLCRVLLRPGDLVWLENPGYHGARNLFRAAGATIIPAPVDERGWQSIERSKACLCQSLFILLRHTNSRPALRWRWIGDSNFYAGPGNMVSPFLRTTTTVISGSPANRWDRCKVSIPAIASLIALRSVNCSFPLCGLDSWYCRTIFWIRFSHSGKQPIVICRCCNKRHSPNLCGPENLAITFAGCANYTQSAGLFWPKLLRSF